MSHEHNIYDSDPHFSIDASTRTITNQSNKNALMQYDHNSERLSFDIPREVDQHDMSLCNVVEVHYINIGTSGQRNTGVYKVDDLRIKQDDNEKVEFTWLVSRNATYFSGTLSFVLKFKCIKNDTIEYEWNTAVCNGITIGLGMNNGEAIITQYADILQGWYNEFIAAGNEGISRVEKARDEAVAYVKDAANAYAENELIPAIEEEIEDEKEFAVGTIVVQADEIVNLVLERLPRAEEASF